MCVCVLGRMGETHWHKKVKDLNEKILDLRVGLEPTTSTILERRLNQLAHQGSYDSSLGFVILRSQILLKTHLITF